MNPTTPTATFTDEHEEFLHSNTVMIKYYVPKTSDRNAGTFQGSGVIIKITPYGSFILTVYHVTRLQPSINIRLAGKSGIFVRAEHIWSIFDSDGSAHDLALYFCPSITASSRITCPVLPAINSTHSLVGQHFYSRGWPNGEQAHTVGEILTEPYKDASVVFEDRELYELLILATANSPMKNGWSGGPCILQSKELIGIFSNVEVVGEPFDKDEKLYLVPYQVIRSFLENAFGVARRSRTLTEEGKRAQLATLRVKLEGLRITQRKYAKDSE